MEKELYAKGEIKVAMEAEDLVITYEGKGGSVKLKVEGEYLLDKLAEAIPGEIDDAVLNMLKAALKG